MIEVICMQDNKAKKDFLYGYRNIQNKIRSLREQMESIREVYSSAKAIEYSDMPKGGGKQKDISDYICQLEQLQEQIDCKVAVLEQRRLDIEQCVAELENGTESRLIRLRYIEGMNWKMICAELGYEWAQTHRIHSNALSNLMMIHNDTL